MMWWNNDVGWGGWIVLTLIMVAFWSLVIFGVVAIFRGDRDTQPANPRPREHNPLQILDERFARGEIDVDEYHARQRVLRPVR